MTGKSDNSVGPVGVRVNSFKLGFKKSRTPVVDSMTLNEVTL